MGIFYREVIHLVLLLREDIWVLSGHLLSTQEEVFHVLSQGNNSHMQKNVNNRTVNWAHTPPMKYSYNLD